MIRLAVFLGNPGPAYERSRHNAGRLLAARLPFYGALSWTKKFKSRFAAAEGAVLKNLPAGPDGASPSGRRYFLMPETWMNRSGEAVWEAAVFLKIEAEEIIVVHDEIELELGDISFKFGGGLGGHNGLRSIKLSLGTGAFWRLRAGIGRPAGRLPGKGGPPVKGVHEGGGGEIAGWVLSDFTAGEEPVLSAALEAAAGALAAALTIGPERLLPEWGKKRMRAA